MEVMNYFETSVRLYWTTRCYNLQNSTVHDQYYLCYIKWKIKFLYFGHLAIYMPGDRHNFFGVVRLP
jgi:hypothetical protein